MYLKGFRQRGSIFFFLFLAFRPFGCPEFNITCSCFLYTLFFGTLSLSRFDTFPFKLQSLPRTNTKVFFTKKNIFIYQSSRSLDFTEHPEHTSVCRILILLYKVLRFLCSLRLNSEPFKFSILANCVVSGIFLLFPAYQNVYYIDAWCTD